jgi:hypothetical protein
MARERAQIWLYLLVVVMIRLIVICMRFDRSLTIVLLAWTNGKILIPIGFRWCVTKPKDKGHKTRLDLTQELIREAIDKGVPFDYLSRRCSFLLRKYDPFFESK